MDVLQTVCRICESRRNLIDLTSQENANTAEKLAAVTTIRIQADDTLPKCVCKKCLSTLRVVYDFLQRCETAEERWQEMAQTYVKEESIDTVENQPPPYDEMGNLPEDEVDMREDQMDIVVEETKIAEPIMPIDESRNEKLFFCKSCGRGFKKSTERNNHVKRHGSGWHWRAHLPNRQPGERNFPCQGCQNSYKTCGGLKKHIASVHMKEKPFSCHLCGKAFSQKARLESHSVSHVQERNYPCEKCLKRFKTRQMLRAHELRHVKNVKPKKKKRECDVCHQFYLSKSTLRIHKLLHTGERPFECNVCKKAFILRNRLTVHIRTHGDPATVLGES